MHPFEARYEPSKEKNLFSKVFFRGVCSRILKSAPWVEWVEVLCEDFLKRPFLFCWVRWSSEKRKRLVYISLHFATKITHENNFYWLEGPSNLSGQKHKKDFSSLPNPSGVEIVSAKNDTSESFARVIKHFFWGQWREGGGRCMRQYTSEWFGCSRTLLPIAYCGKYFRPFKGHTRIYASYKGQSLPWNQEKITASMAVPLRPQWTIPNDTIVVALILLVWLMGIASCSWGSCSTNTILNQAIFPLDTTSGSQLRKDNFESLVQI